MLPTYLFIACLLGMIATGLMKTLGLQEATRFR